MSDEKKRPVQTVEHGQVKAAIWENEGRNGAFYRVTFSRSYKDDDGWHNTDSFGLFDLWNLVHCAGEAYVWIAKATSEAREAA